MVIVIELLALLKLKISINAYKNYWEDLVISTQSNNKKYIALGDSAAQGVGAGTVNNSYVSLITEFLENKYNSKLHIINLSVSGAKVLDVISNQLPLLEKIDIDSNTFITLDIGGNDMEHHDDIKFSEQIDRLFALLPKQTIVADIAYFGGGRKSYLEPNVQNANKIIHEKALKHGLKIADLYKITKQKNSVFNNSADFFHPNNRGYRNWFLSYRNEL